MVMVLLYDTNALSVYNKDDDDDTVDLRVPKSWRDGQLSLT